MATLNPAIFRAYDVRGIYGKDFDAGFAQRLGSKVAEYLKTGVVVIGRDGRTSSEDLIHAVRDGALHVGAQVIDVGLVSSPQFYWAVRRLGAAGGIMVTASHNPDDYNGFKVIARRGDTLEIIGGDHVRQIYDSHSHGHRPTGSVQKVEIISEYAQAIARAAGIHGRQALQLSLDAPESVRQTFEQIADIAPDHGLAVRFDADGDRIAFFERGKPVIADWIFTLLTEKLRLGPLVMDLRFSRAVRERLHQRHVPYVLSPVGRLSMVQHMHHTNAAFGGELSGHYYWKEFGGMEAPELVLLRVLHIIQESGQNLAELVAPYVKYYKSEEISIPVKDRKAAQVLLARVRQQYGEGKIIDVDGITVEYPDWWLNLRPSNTEPVVRLMLEAEKKDLLDQKIQEVRVLLA